VAPPRFPRSGIQSYIILHDPFVYPTTPGLNHPHGNQTIWVTNDVGSSDWLVSLVDQPTKISSTLAATSVPPDADFYTAMALAVQGQREISVVANPAAAGWTQLGSHLRCCHPLPHKYIVPALTLVQGGLADHETMWEGLTPDLLSHPPKTVAHCPLLNFIKLMATRCPPTIAGQTVDRPVESRLPFPATFVDDTIPNQMVQIKTARLPGLVPITGATTQLATLQQTQMAFFQTQATAKAKSKMLTEYNSNVASTILCPTTQVSSDAQLPSYWRTRAKLKCVLVPSRRVLRSSSHRSFPKTYPRLWHAEREEWAQHLSDPDQLQPQCRAHSRKRLDASADHARWARRAQRHNATDDGPQGPRGDNLHHTLH
jgi:hypothetical protein